MANIFVNLPAPAANGSGAAVDVSTFGALKTLTVTGNGGVFEPFVTIECSNELVPVHWFPLWTFNTPTEQTFEVACHWMRAKISNYRGGGAPTVEVGGTDDGTTFAQLAVPAGNGVGAGSDVSALGLFKTVQVGGPFRGQVNVEISENGGVSWATTFSYALSGGQSLIVAADFMRVSRNGVPMVSPGLPDIWVAGTSPVGGGGGGGGSVDVQQDGVDVVNPATTLNFQSPGTLATNAGGGVADIFATLIPTGQTFTPAGGATFFPDAGLINVINSSSYAAPAFSQAEFPAANSVPNGTPMVLKLSGGPMGPVPDGIVFGAVIPLPQIGDTLDGFYINGGTPFPDLLTTTGQAQVWVSDGVSNWWLAAVQEPAVPLFPSEQAFLVTCAGTENPNGFPVVMPKPMVDGNYVVEITMGANTFLLEPAAIVRTATTITVQLSAAPTAGDELLFIVKQITGLPS